MPPTAKLKDGLPRRAYAYAPSADPATWKLPILDASGKVDEARLGPAAAAMSAGGFRGQKADVPEANVSAVKARIRQAYKRAGKKPEEMPDSIREGAAEDARTLRESALSFRQIEDLLRDAVKDQWTGGDPDWDQDAADAKALAGGGPTPALPPTYCWVRDVFDDRVVWSTADDDLWQIGYRLDPVAGSVELIGEPQEVVERRMYVPDPDAGVAESAAAALDAASVAIREAGRRNSTADQTRIQSAHDAIVAAGASCTAANVAESYRAARSVVATGEPRKVTILESGYQEAAGPSAFTTLREADAVFTPAPEGQRGGWVTITPIRPGWGNSRDKNYYPASTLKAAVESGVFVGRKMFRDHPTPDADKARPERSTADWIATIKETDWDATKERPRANVRVYDQEAYDRWQDAPDEIAFSILGGGVARPGSVDGQQGNIVESLASVRSVDWVTEAGAGGAIAFAESAATAEEALDVDLATLTPDQIRDGNPALYAQLTGKVSEGEPTANTPAGGQSGQPAAPAAPAAAAPAAATTTTQPQAPAAPAPEAPAAAAPEAPAPPAGTDVQESIAAMQRRLQELELREARVGAKATAASLVEAAVAASTLTAPVKGRIVARFQEATVGPNMLYPTDEALKAEVDREVAYAQELLGQTPKPSSVVGQGGAPVEGQSLREAAVASASDLLAGRFGGNDDAKSQRREVVIPAGGDLSVLGSAPAGADAAALAKGTGQPVGLTEAGTAAQNQIATAIGR